MIRMIKYLLLSLLLVGCSEQHHQHHHKAHVVESKKVLDDGSYMYYYMFYESTRYDSATSAPVAYYTNTSRITSYNNISPTPVSSGKVPADVEEQEHSETVSEIDFETGQMTEQLELDFENVDTASGTSTEVDTSGGSTDSGDSGDSGGGGE